MVIGERGPHGEVIKINLIGKRFGRWFVLQEDGYINKSIAWVCRCDCGTIKRINGANLRNGNSTSCGCLGREVTSARSIKHGMHKSPEYRAWINARERTVKPTNKAYKNYGGRGIAMYPEWYQNFETFYAYMGPRPGKDYSLDRIDVDGNYEPGNVRWTTWKTQQNNRRTVNKLQEEVDLLKRQLAEFQNKC